MGTRDDVPDVPDVPDMTAPLIEARGLIKRYPNGVEALRGVDLYVRPGEMVGLLGPSGAGKTTLLRLLGLAVWPTAGTLHVLGRDVTLLRGARLHAARRRIAAVAQQHSLVPRATARHNVLLGRAGGAPLWRALLAALRPTAADRAAAFAALAEVGIGALLNRPVDSLSGGQQQRVAVARALLHGGDLLLADEPVASVDQETAELILGVLRNFSARGGAVLVSLHQSALAHRFCTRLLVLRDGQVEYDGPPQATSPTTTAAAVSLSAHAARAAAVA